MPSLERFRELEKGDSGEKTKMLIPLTNEASSILYAHAYTGP